MPSPFKLNRARAVLVLLAVGAATATPLTAAEASTIYKVSVSVNPNLIDVSPNHSERSSITGRVSGGPISGRSVHLYAYNNTQDPTIRHDLGTAPLSSTGRFSRSFRPSEGGVWRIQAVKAAVGSIRQGSGSSTLNAYEWGYPHEFPHSSGLNVLIGKNGTEYVNGTRFGETEIILRGGQQATFDIRAFQCTKMNFKIGVADSSAGYSGSYRIYQPAAGKDDRTIKAGTMHRGQSAYDASTSKTVRDLLIGSRTVVVKVSGPSNVKFVLGNAKIACTFPSMNS